jgi:DNA-binding MarR family transcriptional regulator
MVPAHRRDSVIVLIRTLAQALRAELDGALAPVGHSLAQQAVMVSLLRAPHATNAELARAAFVAPQSMAELLQSLARMGFVTRSPAPDNARQLRTKLTAAGERAVARAGAELAEVEAKLTRELSAAERRQLVDLLQRALASIGA